MGINENHFWQLVEKEHQQARSFCSRLTDGSDDSDDLYQDAVVHAFHGFKSLRQTNSFRPWFYQIIRNSYISRFRTGWWKRVTLKSDEIENIGWDHNPTTSLDAKRQLEYAMKALSPDDRTLMILFELEGWKISELAEMTSKTEGLIKMRLSRARAKMREELAVLYRKTAKHIKVQG
jgi:RNA polymerase sigma factor (sigma-70 family)